MPTILTGSSSNSPIVNPRAGIGDVPSIGKSRQMKLEPGWMPRHATATSFGLATSYVLSMSHKDGLSRYWPIIAAVGVGAMRVAAAKHFPTDVLVAAAMGSGTAFIIHRIRF